MKKLSTAEMNRLSPEAFREAPKVPLVAVLDNVRSQHNVGAVFRTADAFRLQGIYLCGICCCPPNDEIHKTALGAENTVDWQYFADTLEAVQALHEAGFTVYAVEQAHDSVTLTETVSLLTAQRSNSIAVQQRSGQTGEAARFAVVFGHEVFGVQQAVVDACDGCIEIPQYGTKHSLNVSVTAGIVLYAISDVLRKLTV